MQKKVGFAAVFINTTRRWAQSEKTSINTVKMAAIKIALKEIHKRWVIYTHSRFRCSQWNKKRKSPDIKSDM